MLCNCSTRNHQVSVGSSAASWGSRVRETIPAATMQEVRALWWHRRRLQVRRGALAIRSTCELLLVATIRASAQRSGESVPRMKPRILWLAPRGEVLLPGLPTCYQIVGRAVFDKLARRFIVPEWLHRLQTGKRFIGDNDGHRVNETERLGIEKNAAAAAKWSANRRPVAAPLSYRVA